MSRQFVTKEANHRLIPNYTHKHKATRSEQAPQCPATQIRVQGWSCDTHQTYLKGPLDVIEQQQPHNCVENPAESLHKILQPFHNLHTASSENCIKFHVYLIWSWTNLCLGKVEIFVKVVTAPESINIKKINHDLHFYVSLCKPHLVRATFRVFYEIGYPLTFFGGHRVLI